MFGGSNTIEVFLFKRLRWVFLVGGCIPVEGPRLCFFSASAIPRPPCPSTQGAEGAEASGEGTHFPRAWTWSHHVHSHVFGKSRPFCHSTLGGLRGVEQLCARNNKHQRLAKSLRLRSG